MEINWTLLTYMVIGLFALSGFFKGWWKEAVTTVFLAILILLLNNPSFAQAVVDIINSIVAFIWGLIPASFLPTVESVLENVFAIDTSGGVPQLDAGNPGTWLIILILFIMIAILVSRLLLPNTIKKSRGYAYVVRPTGSILGGLMGALNGFLIVNLVREYLDGRNLPAAGPPAELAMAESGRAMATASSGVTVQAVEMPGFTILDSSLPWILMGIGFLVLLVILKNRVGLHSRNGFRKIDYKVPYGYQKIDI